jgi:thioredoxin 1
MPLRPIADHSFSETLNADKKPILLHFSADWCGPCKTIAPDLEVLATNFGSEIDFFKLDVDHNPQSDFPTVVIETYDDLLERVKRKQGVES